MSKVMLVKYDAACKALAEATSVDEVMELYDRAEMIRLYHRQSKNKNLELQAAKIRIRAERRLGELLAETDKSSGAKGIGKSSKTPIKSAVTREDRTPKKTLNELGLSKNESARAQKVSKIPEPVFNEKLEELDRRVLVDGAKVTTNILKVGEEKEKKTDQKPTERRIELHMPHAEYIRWSDAATEAKQPIAEWVRSAVNAMLATKAAKVIDITPQAEAPSNIRDLPPKGSAWSLRGWRHMINTYNREPTEAEWELYQHNRL